MKAANDRIEAEKARGQASSDARSGALIPAARTQWGTSHVRVLANMVEGVSEGFTRRRSNLSASAIVPRCRAQDVKLALGFSHDVVYAAPEGITLSTSKPTESRHCRR
jgi:large subunit ribosomal protein L6